MTVRQEPEPNGLVLLVTDGIWTIFLTPRRDVDGVQRTLVCADTLGRAVFTMLKDKRARCLGVQLDRTTDVRARPTIRYIS